MKRLRQGVALALIGAGAAVVPMTAADAKPDPGLAEQMRAAAQGTPRTATDPSSGRLGFVRAAKDGDLMPSVAAARSGDPAKAAAAKSRAWLDKYSPTLGARPGELTQSSAVHDNYGTTVTYVQTYQGLPVFGGMIKANVDNDGDLTAVTGFAAPDLAVRTDTRHTAEEAGARAVRVVKAKPPTGEDGRASDLSALKATAVTKAVYRTGSTRGVSGKNLLAFTAIVTNGTSVRDMVVLDAQSLKPVNRWSMVNENLDREMYTYDEATDEAKEVWKEGESQDGLAQDQKNMLASTAETYGLFKNTFGRDSYDGAGATMTLLHNSPNDCPNASWNGQYTQYCDGVEDDDTVAHEWGHAYTEYTAGLVYQWQSGALNESYSDVWGETVDLLNNREDDKETGLTAKRPDGKCSTYTRGAVTATFDAPASIAGACETAVPASFGPQFTPAGVTGTVVVAKDEANATGPTETDGCTPITNAGDVAGKWAFVDRGVCPFATKIKNVVDTGAAGIVMGNNAAGALSLSGNYDNLYGVMVSKNDGDKIKSAGGPVTMTVTETPRDSVDSHRWLLSEGSTAFGGAIRDMWNPTCYGDPGKVSDAEYQCDPADHGGVHGNSGVPNHAYALLVDGGTYNGKTVNGLGLDKAAAIYYRSLTAYLTSTSDFVDQADALEASCADLTGKPIKKLTLEPGATAPAATPITATDCAQVAAVNTAVEFRTDPTSQCKWTPMFDPNTPSVCGDGFSTVDVWSEDFSDGLAGWTPSSDVEFTGGIHAAWAASSSAPGHHAGGVAYGPAPEQGSCTNGAGDFSSVDWIASPAVTIPSAGASPRLSFDHYVATEGGFDGGLVQFRTSGGAWTTVPTAAYVFNGPQPFELSYRFKGDNTNPLSGLAQEVDGFTGTDPGAARGSWGTSIIDLSKAKLPTSGTVEFRFGIGRDGCGGIDGWYVDNVKFQVCEVATKVTASIAPATVNVGVSSVVTARVNTATGAGLQPRGTVQVTDASGAVLAKGTVASGTPIKLTVPGTTKPGARVLTVAYLGDGRQAPSSTKVTQTVVDPNAPKPPVASTTSVKVNPAKPRKGKAFTVVATVRASKPVTGSVTVTIDGKKVGTAKLRSGKAKVTVSAKAAKKFRKGKHTAKAMYRGSATVRTSTGTKKFTIRR